MQVSTLLAISEAFDALCKKRYLNKLSNRQYKKTAAASIYATAVFITIINYSELLKTKPTTDSFTNPYKFFL